VRSLRATPPGVSAHNGPACSSAERHHVPVVAHGQLREARAAPDGVREALDGVVVDAEADEARAAEERGGELVQAVVVEAQDLERRHRVHPGVHLRDVVAGEVEVRDLRGGNAFSDHDLHV
jgi:hypothetical protein